ncbi:uncharacterized protein LOC111519297 [Drosophila willistoni]|uniref:uncharacterized protein LOC111519297 n=1 Tax=Drosophila willistoni TaxID=7260 RepID=UPI000C26CCCE|nr:uncharacterized protein LOC111519297 [Drosophila willistoni]
MQGQTTPVQRLNVHLTLLVLAEYSTKVIHMLEFISICHAGISDDVSMVRRHACYSMATMVQNFLPKITRLDDNVMPMFIKFLEHMSETHRLVPKEAHINTSVFSALEEFVEQVTVECMKPHLEKLIPLILLCTEPEKNSMALRQLSVSAIAKLAECMQASLDDHFDDNVSVIRPVMVQTQLEEELALRAHAIHVCSALNLVNQTKFSKVSPWIFEVVIEMCHNGTVTEFYTFSILGVISGIIPEVMRSLHRVAMVIKRIPMRMNRLQIVRS